MYYKDKYLFYETIMHSRISLHVQSTVRASYNDMERIECKIRSELMCLPKQDRSSICEELGKYFPFMATLLVKDSLPVDNGKVVTIDLGKVTEEIIDESDELYEEMIKNSVTAAIVDAKLENGAGTIIEFAERHSGIEVIDTYGNSYAKMRWKYWEKLQSEVKNGN